MSELESINSRKQIAASANQASLRELIDDHVQMVWACVRHQLAKVNVGASSAHCFHVAVLYHFLVVCLFDMFAQVSLPAALEPEALMRLAANLKEQGTRALKATRYESTGQD